MNTTHTATTTIENGHIRMEDLDTGQLLFERTMASNSKAIRFLKALAFVPAQAVFAQWDDVSVRRTGPVSIGPDHLNTN